MNSRWRRAGRSVVLLVLGISALTCAPAPDVDARAGVLDLRSWDPVVGGPVRLEGEWAFYWHRLVPPDEVDDVAPDLFVSASAPWNGKVVNGEKLGGFGFATYHLRILLPAGKHNLALRVRDLLTAYRLYADGRLVASAGRLGRDHARSRPAYGPRIADLPAVGASVDLVLQISNFDCARGGPWQPMAIGTLADVRGLREATLMFQLFLCGTMVIMGLYHLGLFAARRADPSPLYFGGACLAMTLRVLSTEERTLQRLIPGLSWQWHDRLEFVSMFLSAVLISLFVLSLYQRDIPNRSFRTLIAIGFGWVLLILATPNRVYAPLLPVMQTYLVVTAIFGTAVVARAARRRRSGALTFTVALAILAATVLYDIAVAAHRVSTPFFTTPVGIFCFVFLQAFLLSRRFSSTLVTVEEMSQDLSRAHTELESYSKELEARVAERTSQLEQANQELAATAAFDSLTGVGNRRAFDEFLVRLWRDHGRRDASLAVLLCDVDFFKEFNDRYGHLRGDEALRVVAGSFQKEIRRPLDFVARYGGEEFAVLLVDTGAELGRQVAERLRAAVEAVRIPHAGSRCADILTTSIGVAAANPGPDSNPLDLVEQADAALYRAKQGGRNRVVLAGDAR